MPNPARTLAVAGLLLAPLAVPVITPGAASAATDGTQVVISEVYGAGGISGALRRGPVRFTTTGQHTLTLRYLGTPAFLPSETAFTVRVRQKPKG